MSIMSSSTCSSTDGASSFPLRHEQLYKESRHGLFSDPLMLIERDMKLIKQKLFSATANNNAIAATDKEEQKLLRKRLIHLEHERKRALKHQKRYWRKSQRHLVVHKSQEQENDENQHGKSFSDKIAQKTMVSPFRRASMLEIKAGSFDVKETHKECQPLNEIVSHVVNDAMAAYLRGKMPAGGCSVTPSGNTGKYAALRSSQTGAMVTPPRRKTIHIAMAA